MADVGVTVRTPHGGTLRLQLAERRCLSFECFRWNVTYDPGAPAGKRLTHGCKTRAEAGCPIAPRLQAPAIWEQRSDGWRNVLFEADASNTTKEDDDDGEGLDSAE